MEMETKQKYGKSTLAIHAGDTVDPATGALTTPIYQTSTFVFPDVQTGSRRFAGEEAGYIYTRVGNPTVRVFEQKIAALEGAEEALAFASGMAAVSAILMGLLKSGDHLIGSQGLYGCSFDLLEMLQERYNITYTLCDLADEASLLAEIRPNTKVIYAETPINPTLQLIDLSLIARVAKARGITTVVDNTFMSPHLQRPIEQGCDIVVHSATKY
ncbi:MAG: trans-sulfuration enzyme family protein, partial [Clostridia bacterium]